MKKLYILAWIILTIGFCFKFLHWPGANVSLLLGNLILLIHSIIFLIQNAKSNLPKSLLYLSISTLTTYLIFRLLYWQFSIQVFTIAFVITIICFISYLAKNIQFKAPQIILALYFIFALRIFFTPAYKIFYFMNFSNPSSAEYAQTSYRVWNNYSWFLYLSNKYGEAEEANKNAQKIYLEKQSSNELILERDKQNYEILKKNEEKIKSKTWVDYEYLK